MPSYADALEPEQVWDVIFYVLALSEEGQRLATARPPAPTVAPPPGRGAHGYR